MMRMLFLLAGCIGLSVTACAQPAPQVPLQAEASITAVGTLQVSDTARRVLGAVPGLQPWKKGDIHHVRLSLYKGTASSPAVSQDVTDLTQQVRFTNLVRDTDYKVVAKAWNDAAETKPIDNYASEAASCETTFHTFGNELIPIGAIKLTLRDKTFSGTTTDASINVVDGTVVDTTATPGIVLK